MSDTEEPEVPVEEGEEEGEPAEKPPPPPPEPIIRAMDLPTLQAGLSQLCKTVGGDGFAFAKLDLSLRGPRVEGEEGEEGEEEEEEEEEEPAAAEEEGEEGEEGAEKPPKAPYDKRIVDMSILSKFTHLRYINMANNRISDLSPLVGLEQLLVVNFDGNAITSLECFAQAAGFPYLQEISLARNQVKDVPAMQLPMLTTLVLKGNEISSVAGLSTLPLKKLDLRGNKLTTTAHLGVPTVTSLLLADNQIAVVEGLEGQLKKAEILDLSNNQLASLEGLGISSAPGLHTLLLSGNKFKKTKELDHLLPLAKFLKTLDLTQTPFSEEAAGPRARVLRRLPALTTLDGEEVTEDDQEATKEEEEPDPEDPPEEPEEGGGDEGEE